MKYIFLLLLFTGSFIGCRRDSAKPYVRIKNNSAVNIVYLYSSDYPDTLHYNFAGCAVNDGTRFVAAGGVAEDIRRTSFSTILDEIPSKKMMYFIFNADSAAKYYNLYHSVTGGYGCDSLRAHPELVLKRFDVTLDYLNTHDWTLVYP